MLTPVQRRIHRKIIIRVAMFIVVLLYMGVRLLNLNALVTTDEPFWLGRSGNFYRAIATQQYEYTYQMAHPGVMTMWAGTIAYLLVFPEYADEAEGNMNVPYGIENHLRRMNQNPLSLMVAAKVTKVLMQSVFFAIAVVFLHKLVGPSTALIGSTLIAFSPMMSGFDSAFHVDGLFTTLCYCAITIICWSSFRDMATAQ